MDECKPPLLACPWSEVREAAPAKADAVISELGYGYGYGYGYRYGYGYGIEELTMTRAGAYTCSLQSST